MSYPFIASHWFTPGPRQGPINKIVLHTIECPCAPGWAKKAADIFAKSTATKVSAHYYVDPTAIIQGVRDTDIAYAAPGANSDGLQIEQAGRAIFTLAQWTDPNGQGLIKQTSTLLADLSSRYNIPLRFCSAADMLASTNARGVTTHAEVNKAYHRSDHTDPGKNYPLDLVLIEARALLNVGASGDVNPPPTQEEEDVPYLMTALAGFQNILASFPNGSIRQMPLSEFIFLRDVGKVPTVTESTQEGIDLILRIANMDHSELVKV